MVDLCGRSFSPRRAPRGSPPARRTLPARGRPDAREIRRPRRRRPPRDLLVRGVPVFVEVEAGPARPEGELPGGLGGHREGPGSPEEVGLRPGYQPPFGGAVPALVLVGEAELKLEATAGPPLNAGAGLEENVGDADAVFFDAG